jgi:uncharacterized protein YkwD
MQLIENKALALALAFTLLVMAIPVGLVHNAGGKQPHGSITAANKGVLGWVAQAGTTTVQAYLPVITVVVQPTPTPPDASAGWLDYVNYYRGLAWLPPVTEDMTLSIAAQQLAACIVASNKFQEYEWQFSAYCQPFGPLRQTAQQSDLYITAFPDTSDAQAIATWMQGPFHALGILDPALQRAGFGSDRDASGAVWMGAALNVTAGFDHSQVSPGTYPVAWPGNRTTVSATTYTAGTDSPEPLSSCAGYPAVTGLPIILQIGDGSLSKVDVSDSSIRAGNTSLEHCRITQNSYVNPNGDEQAAGRRLLAARNAIVLVPKNPLAPGTHYSVSVTVNGSTYQWSFQEASN